MVQRNASLQIDDLAAGFCEAVDYLRRRMSPPARLSVAQISKEGSVPWSGVNPEACVLI
jgi:hypothetical protein